MERTLFLNEYRSPVYGVLFLKRRNNIYKIQIYYLLI